MISRILGRLPGPVAVRALLVVLAGVIALVLLGLLYEWVGSAILDTGGRIG